MARLIPRETKFFDMFADIAGNVIEGAKALHDLLEDWDYQRLPEVAQRIRAIEHRGDEMTHQLLVKLNQTFITPFDREDIHLLASSLDDVLDFIYGASNRLVNYKITQPTPSAKILAGIILTQAEELDRAVRLSRKRSRAAKPLRGSEPAGERSRPGDAGSHRPAV